MFKFNSKFDFGATNRINESASGIAIFNLSKSVQIGYASYETSFESSARSIDNVIHEIMLNLKL